MRGWTLVLLVMGCAPAPEEGTPDRVSILTDGDVLAADFESVMTVRARVMTERGDASGVLRFEVNAGQFDDGTGISHDAAISVRVNEQGTARTFVRCIDGFGQAVVGLMRLTAAYWPPGATAPTTTAEHSLWCEPVHSQSRIELVSPTSTTR